MKAGKRISSEYAQDLKAFNLMFKSFNITSFYIRKVQIIVMVLYAVYYRYGAMMNNIVRFISKSKSILLKYMI